MTGFAFTKAVRRKSKLRLALTGPSGSGKTYGALLIAKGLGGRTAVIDSEHGSASLYAGLPEMPEFDVVELAPPYSPERYRAAIEAARRAGYDNVVVDSMTHEWNGSGGVLELVDQVAAAKYRGNAWSAWNDLTPRHRDFVDALLQFPGHVICTMRSKTDTAQVEENGRKKVVKLGMKSEQRDGTDYEFTVVLDIVHAGNYATASKDRTGLFAGNDPERITAATGQQLLAWLNSGADPLPVERVADEPPAQDSEPPASVEPSDEPSDEPPARPVRDVRPANPSAMLPKHSEMHALALESCDTRAELDKAWKAAKAECQKVGDTEAYAVLKSIMERSAARIRQQATQPA